MTDAVASQTGTGTVAARRTRGGGPDRMTIALLSVTAFLLLLAVLGSQLRHTSSAVVARPRSVIVRKVYVTTVVERIPAGSSAPAPRPTSVTSVSAPVTAAAPAPVVTRTSGAVTKP